MTNLIQKLVPAASGKEKKWRKYQRMRCGKKLRFSTKEEAEVAREEKTTIHNKQYEVYLCRGEHYHLTTHYERK